MSSTLSLDAVLLRLNLITDALNLLRGDDFPEIRETLRLVVSSIADLLPGSAAVVLGYDQAADRLDVEGQVWAGAGAADGTWLLPDQVHLAHQVARQGELLAVDRGQPVRYLPLRAAGDVLGILVVRSAEDRPFNPVERSLLDHLASLAARILVMARQSVLAKHEQARRENELHRLHRAGMLISSRSSLKDTLDAILNMALEFTDASYGIFRLVDLSGTNLVTRSFAGTTLARPATEVLPISTNSVMGVVALKREPVVVSDLREEPWRSVYYPFDYALEMRSEIALPLIGASGRLEGVLNLESLEVNTFDNEDRYILQILATQAVVAIEGIRLVDALQDISAMLTTCSLQQIHQALAEKACDLLNLPISMIWLMEKDQLVVQAASDSCFCGRRMPLGNDPISQSIRTGASVILMDAADSLPVRDPLQQGPGSALIVPLFTGDDPRPVGAFSVYTGAGDARDFSQADWDKKVLSILGHYAALAIQNAAHLDALRFAEDQRATTETFAAIGEIAANLLHRLNNKIGTIPVRVEGIQDKCLTSLQSDPYLADNLAEIQCSASEAMQVVRESLDHLRPIQLHPVSVAAAVNEAVASIRLPEAVQVECQGLDQLPLVQAGANRLTLVFNNLLENAADAMESQGKIRLEGAVRGQWVEVRVSDTGPGIPPHLHERIFEFSYSSRPSAHPGKLGFGLWWVKSLMTRFGGKVAVESAGTRGTTFILNLPVAQEQA